MGNPSEWITMREAARRLGMSSSWIRKHGSAAGVQKPASFAEIRGPDSRRFGSAGHRDEQIRSARLARCSERRRGRLVALRAEPVVRGEGTPLHSKRPDQSETNFHRLIGRSVHAPTFRNVGPSEHHQGADRRFSSPAMTSIRVVMGARNRTVWVQLRRHMWSRCPGSWVSNRVRCAPSPRRAWSRFTRRHTMRRRRVPGRRWPLQNCL